MSGKLNEYKGKDVTVRYEVKRCTHAAECVRGLPQVFDPDRKPWVEPDAAAADQVAGVIMRCPTGALHFEREDGGPSEPVPADNTIDVAADGPLYARGEVEIVDGSGSIVLRDTRVAFCRCGASQNKPFCDGRHAEAGFRHTGALAESTPRPDEFEAGGKLTVNPASNGPLLLQGSVEIRSADGRTSFYGGKAALCRCGASKKKPFCDGSHRAIDFHTD
ncbi:MAG: hypothetical protein AMS25_03785 [Gemmatimonas sp. SM23_52]|nr:MAG: hypothetical protein AMS25_03785 [Gemmatimonas sp. SM23_52]